MTAVVHKDGQMHSHGVGSNASLGTTFLVDYEQAVILWCGVPELYGSRQFAFTFNVAVAVLTPL